MSRIPGRATEIESMLAAWQQRNPPIYRAIRTVAEQPLLADSLQYLLHTHPKYVEDIAPFLEIIGHLYTQRGASLDQALDSLTEYTVLFMRHQVSFLKTGKYSNTNFNEVFNAVYDDRKFMTETYLPGLYLSQLFWPIHYHVLDAYRRRFLCGLDQVTQLLEVGVGHGMTLLCALRAQPPATAVALDVSPHALLFAKQLLDAADIPSHRCCFEQFDITKGTMDGIRVDAATMGEVLEHVESPSEALNNLRSMMKPGALAFITTVIDSNAVDHIFQFKSQTEIDRLIENSLLRVHTSKIIVPAELRLESKAGSDPTKFYYAIAQAK